MEERNVTFTLEKAKEWYKKGGELKEVALQAFKEEELNDNKPRSWNEYCKQQSIKGAKGYLFDSINIRDCYWSNFGFYSSLTWRSVLPSKELAEAFLAMMQLMSLRQEWIGDWEPDWSKETSHKNPKYCIILKVSKGFSVEICYNNWIQILSFPTQEMAEDFMNTFKDLLEIAKPLI